MVQGEKLRLVVTLKNSSKGSNQILNITDEVCNVVGSSKGQLISKANSKLFTGTKNQRKCFCISALASKIP